MDRGEDSEMVSSGVTSWTRLDLEPKNVPEASWCSDGNKNEDHPEIQGGPTSLGAGLNTAALDNLFWASASAAPRTPELSYLHIM